MDSSVSPKGDIWFLRVCHHISDAVYSHAGQKWLRRMGIAFRITKIRIHTHTHTHTSCLILIVSHFFNSVRSHKTFYGSLCKQWETAQRLVSFVVSDKQVLSLKEAIKKTSIPLYQCGIGHFTWWPTYVVLLPATYVCLKSIVAQHSISSYSSQWRVAQRHPHRMRWCLTTLIDVFRNFANKPK